MLAALAALWLAGCAQQPVVSPQPQVSRCLGLYAALADAVASHGSSPSYPPSPGGFPHLALDRFHVALGRRLDEPNLLGPWIDRLASLGARVNGIQLASLPSAVRVGLTDGDAHEALSRCSLLLRARDRQSPERLSALRNFRVADDYLTALRVLGLYPLSSLPVRLGVARYHAATLANFAQPLSALPVMGQLRRYRLSPATGSIRLPRRDALDVPVLQPRELEALFHRHAPVWEVDTVGDFDHIGAPFWRGPGLPSVNSRQPVAYYYPSFGFWQDRPVLQLNYLVWFAARPANGVMDILAGWLDGLHWRVTLDHRGEPLLYDTIHPCGCYHMLFPTAGLALRPEALALPEPPLIPQEAPDPGPDQHLVLRIASASHYLRRIYVDRASGQEIELLPYEALYRVATGEGKAASLFSARGLVTGTERGERWLLWPMGIASPGGMRERGRHPIAFVGRRHFDDPELLERFFQPAQSR